MKKNKKHIKKNKKILAEIILLLVIAAVAIWLIFYNKKPTSPGQDTASYTPATEQEKQETEKHKQVLANQQSQTPPPSGSLKNVTVVITEANSAGIKGYVSGVFEEDGTCTANATQGSQ